MNEGRGGWNLILVLPVLIKDVTTKAKIRTTRMSP